MSKLRRNNICSSPRNRNKANNDEMNEISKNGKLKFSKSKVTNNYSNLFIVTMYMIVTFKIYQYGLCSSRKQPHVHCYITCCLCCSCPTMTIVIIVLGIYNFYLFAAHDTWWILESNPKISLLWRPQIENVHSTFGLYCWYIFRNT